jgi:Uma2 family endonuclease
MNPLQSALPRRGKPMTLNEWSALPEDEPGELVDGCLVEEEEVGALHDLVGAWFVALLSSVAASQRGFVGLSDTRFAVSPTGGRKPDVWAYFGGRRPRAEGVVETPPDLVVEVVSSAPRDQRRDRVEKLAEYSAFGIHWYWIADPQLRSFEILELGADHRYVHAVVATTGTVQKVPGLPGLTIDLDALWAQVDALTAVTQE